MNHVGVAQVNVGTQGLFGQLVGGQVEQRVDGAAQHGVNAGVGIGSEGVTQGELEIALKVDEIGQLNGQVGDLDGASDPRSADV